MITSLKNLFPLALKKIDYAKRGEVLTTAGLYSGIVKKLINQKAAQNSRVLDLKNKVLLVRTASSVWSCEISFYTDQILEEINKYFGENKAERARFLVG